MDLRPPHDVDEIIWGPTAMTGVEEVGERLGGLLAVLGVGD
jgi:hypothetical protein